MSIAGQIRALRPGEEVHLDAKRTTVARTIERIWPHEYAIRVKDGVIAARRLATPRPERWRTDYRPELQVLGIGEAAILTGNPQVIRNAANYWFGRGNYKTKGLHSGRVKVWRLK